MANSQTMFVPYLRGNNKLSKLRFKEIIAYASSDSYSWVPTIKSSFQLLDVIELCLSPADVLMSRNTNAAVFETT